ncbi:MAG: hypothetical protein RLZZ292_653 [Bacteroidota bacterium]|jgi:hypothetical protein
MDAKNELHNALGTWFNQRATVTLIPAFVTSVSEEGGKMDVKDLDDNEIFDIRLRAATGGAGSGVFILPKVGSAVVIGCLGNSPNDYVVLQYTEVTKVKFKVNTTEFSLEDTGIDFKRGTEGLKSILGDLLDAINAITVTTPQGPSGTPLNFLSFSAIKQRLNNLLK